MLSCLDCGAQVSASQDESSGLPLCSSCLRILEKADRNHRDARIAERTRNGGRMVTPSTILPAQLFVGDEACAASPARELRERFGITAIVVCGSHLHWYHCEKPLEPIGGVIGEGGDLLREVAPLQSERSSAFHYLGFEADDMPTQDIIQFLPYVLQFIDNEVKRGGAVLVHCASGISRSGTIAIAYLMMRFGLTFDTAWERAREGRPEIHPNSGFQKQLRSVETVLMTGDLAGLTVEAPRCAAEQKRV